MRYRNAWMLTFMLLAVACKPTAPVAEAAVATPAATESVAAATVEPPAAAQAPVAAGFTKGMPYATLRGTLTEAGWLPLRDPECWDNVGGTARVCGQLPEVESCSGDGHCVMHFANADTGERISVTTYGPHDRWNVPGEEAAFAVQSWEVSSLPAAAKAANATAPACPSRDFDAFLQSFASDEGVERAFTAPVVKTAELYSDDDGDHQRMVYMTSEDYREFNVKYAGNGFHYVDSAGKVDASTLKLDITQENAKARTVRYRYGMSEGNAYRFQDNGNCWYLTEDPQAPAP